MTEHDHTHQAASARRRIRHMTRHRSTAVRLFAIAFGVAAALTLSVAVHAGRNSTGTYSLPAGTTVTGGTTITSAWANNFTGDVSTELTASLDRSGRGGMLAPLKCVDGSVSAPGLTFGNEPGTGLYRIGSSNPGMAVAGSKKQEWTSGGTAVTGTLGVTGDVTLSVGNLLLTRSADQYITKTGGALWLGTGDSQGIAIQTNNVLRFEVVPSGDLTSNGTAKVTGLPSPSNVSDAATKGYVDTALALKAPLASPTFTGTVTLGGALGVTGATTLSGGVAGNTAFSGKPTASATVSGDGDTTLTTKGYVDGKVPGRMVWAILTCGAGGTVTVTAGSGVASASYALSVMSITWTTAFTSETSYALVAIESRNTGSATHTVSAPVGGGARSGANGILTGRDFSGATRNWASGDVVQIIAFGS